MREQAPFLEHVADPAAMAGEKRAVRRIEHRGFPYGRSAGLGTGQAGDYADEGRLAGARAAEQRDEPASGLEAGFEQETAQAMLDVDGEHHSTSRRRLA